MGNKGGIFRFADRVDKVLMLVGSLASIGEGLAGPLGMYVLSGAMGAFGTADQSIEQSVVDKVYIHIHIHVFLLTPQISFYWNTSFTLTTLY